MVNRDVAYHEMGKHGLCLDLGSNAQDGESCQSIGEKHCGRNPVNQELNNELILGSTVPCPLKRQAFDTLSDARKACIVPGEDGGVRYLFITLIEDIGSRAIYV